MTNPKGHVTSSAALMVVWGLQVHDECGSIVGWNAAFVCAGGFEYRLRRIGAIDAGACNRVRRASRTEEVERAGKVTVGDAVGYDDERFGGVECKDGITGVVRQRNTEHRSGLNKLPDAAVFREREGDIVTGRRVHDGSQNRMQKCNEGDGIRRFIVNRAQKLVRPV